jgi:hypothetical protein
MLTAFLSWVPGSFPFTLKTFQHGTCRSIRGLIRLPGASGPFRSSSSSDSLPSLIVLPRAP